METITTTDIGQNLGTGGAIPSGEIRRVYNFGNYVSEIRVDQTPFFRLASVFAKVPTDDAEFKSLEQRSQWQRRYVYVLGGSALTGTNHWSGTAWNSLSEGDEISGYLNFGSDYKNTGQFAPSNQTSLLNTSGTKPLYLLTNQTLSIPVTLEDTSESSYLRAYGFMVVQITSFGADSGNQKVAKVRLLKKPTFVHHDTREQITVASDDKIYIGHPPPGYLSNKKANNTSVLLNIYPVASTPASIYKERRVRIIGNGYGLGSGYGEGWIDNLSDTYGYTQIFKNVAEMDGTTMATRFRGRANEWIAAWGNALADHKMDIERTAHWGTLYRTTDASGKIMRFTNGAVNYVLSNGHVFPFREDSYSYDDFIDDWSSFMDAENGDGGNVAVFASSEFYNWFARLESNSFYANTVSNASTFGSINSRINILGNTRVAGINVKQLEIEGTRMNLIKDKQLDGTHVKMLCVNLRHMLYRPLVGNTNRDTSIYPKVKSIEKNGEDVRVDLVQTEAGFDFGVAESHAIWTVLSS